ncbi:MAG: homocysteine S-methyltransferase family protein [Nanoarchaeota archaeon]|nr:homocysteine S-methyltransferase family protein [Nanoarchaeota archaeon]
MTGDAGIVAGAYANLEAADPSHPSGYSRDPALTSEAYADYAERWVERGARIIGGCCGTRPEDLALIARWLAPAVTGRLES